MLCYVVQPNSVVLEVVVGPKSKGREILEKVCELLGIRTESDYFGLKYATGPPGTPVSHWLNLRNSVERTPPDPAVVPPRRFALSVKFWVPPHLVLSTGARRLMCDEAKVHLRNHRFPSVFNLQDEVKSRLGALLALSHAAGDLSHCADWAQVLRVDTKPVTDKYQLIKAMKRDAAEYWVLKILSGLEEFGEEEFTGKTGLFAIGPRGLRLPTGLVPFEAIKSARVLKRTLTVTYVTSDNEETSTTEIDIKTDSVLSCTGLYRSLIEKHDFYACDTVRCAVTEQYIRDLKGTIVSIFNEGTPLGKKYVFDIQRTCREVHDRARRSLFSLSPEPGESSMNSQPVEPPSFQSSIKELYTCRVCMDNEMNTVFFPCAHVVCCSSCATVLSNCPLCRSVISSSHKLYLPQLPS